MDRGLDGEAEEKIKGKRGRNLEMTGACLVALVWWVILYNHSATSTGKALQQHITVNCLVSGAKIKQLQQIIQHKNIFPTSAQSVALNLPKLAVRLPTGCPC